MAPVPVFFYHRCQTNSFRSKSNKAVPKMTFPKGYGLQFSLPEDQLLDFSHAKPEELDIKHERHARGMYPLVILIEVFPQALRMQTPPNWQFDEPRMLIYDALLARALHVPLAEEAAEAAAARKAAVAASEAKTEGASPNAEANSTAEAAAGSASASSPPIVGASAGTDDTTPSKHVHSQSTFFNLVGPLENLELKPIAQKIMVRSLPRGKCSLARRLRADTDVHFTSLLTILLDAGGGHAVLFARDLRH